MKTLEEIRLERIQAESAAYYGYEAEHKPEINTNTGNDLRRRLAKRLGPKVEDFSILTLDEIRQKKIKRRVQENTKSNEDFKVMTLDEIRAAKRKLYSSNDVNEPKKQKQDVDSSNEHIITEKHLRKNLLDSDIYLNSQKSNEYLDNLTLTEKECYERISMDVTDCSTNKITNNTNKSDNDKVISSSESDMLVSSSCIVDKDVLKTEESLLLMSDDEEIGDCNNFVADDLLQNIDDILKD